MKWEKVKLGDVCEITSSKRIFYSEYVDDGVPFYRSKEIIESNEGKIIENPLYISVDKYNEIKEKFGVPQTGDMLLTSVGTIGIPYIIKKKDCFYFKDGNLTWFRDFREGLNSKYLYYWIKSSEGTGILYNTTIGSSQKALTISALKNIKVSLPPRSVQDKIVEVVSAYDDLIENNQKQIKLLEEAAQRLYKEWFVDLRFPGHENTKIVDGVPEGWRVASIADICDTVGGGTPSTKIQSYYEKGDILWVTPTDITRNFSLALLDTEKKITPEGLKNSSAKMLPAETILMTSRASVGFFGMCKYEVCTNQGFISCIPKRENLQMYLLFNLKSRVEEIRQKAGGSTYLEISKTVFRELKIILPKDEVLAEYQKNVHDIFDEIYCRTEMIKSLVDMRNRLLPKLMSGEVEV